MLKTSAALICLAALVGCTGTSTYGTGTSQEMQLAKDLGSLVSFKRTKAAKIAYEERPGLVKPGAATLPAPVETAAASSGEGVSAFPVSPEQRRAQRRASVAGGAKPSASNGSTGDDNLSAEDRKYMDYSGPTTPAYRRWLTKRARGRKRGAQVIAGDAPRRYLTQPPAEYRKPYDSAPQGEVGDKESTKAFKKRSKGNIFSKLLGRG